jgi:hypothetical protein
MSAPSSSTSRPAEPTVAQVVQRRARRAVGCAHQCDQQRHQDGGEDTHADPQGQLPQVVDAGGLRAGRAQRTVGRGAREESGGLRKQAAGRAVVESKQ